MKFFVLKCPNCSSSLEIENGLDTFYCKYCGHKIVLDGQSEANLKAKLSLKEMEHKETLQDKELAHDRYKMDLKAARKKRNSKTITIIFLVIILSFASLIAISGWYEHGREASFRAEQEMNRQEHLKEVARLEDIEDDIMVDIANKDYDSALVKTNTLYYHVSWNLYNSGVEEQWNAVRESLIETIKAAKQNYNK